MTLSFAIRHQYHIKGVRLLDVVTRLGLHWQIAEMVVRRLINTRETRKKGKGP